MNKHTSRPKVGVGVMVYNEAGEVLLGKRCNSHGAGSWSFPGGHLEWGESPEACAKRETYEETGLGITDIEQKIYTNDVFEEEGLHYVTVFVRARALPGTPKLMEPHKCEEWQWFEPSALPEPLFLPVKHFVEQLAEKGEVLVK